MWRQLPLIALRVQLSFGISRGRRWLCDHQRDGGLLRGSPSEPRTAGALAPLATREKAKTMAAMMRLFQSVVTATGRMSSSVEANSHPDANVLPQRKAGLRSASTELRQISAPTSQMLARDASKWGQMNAEAISHRPSAKLT